MAYQRGSGPIEVEVSRLQSWTETADVDLYGRAGGGIGCSGSNGGTAGNLTVTGAFINGIYSSAVQGEVRFSATATNYIVVPENASYAITNCLTTAQILAGTCTNALILPTNPGITNVLSGTSYGPYSGTYTCPGGGGGVCAVSY